MTNSPNGCVIATSWLNWKTNISKQERCPVFFSQPIKTRRAYPKFVQVFIAGPSETSEVPCIFFVHEGMLQSLASRTRIFHEHPAKFGVPPWLWKPQIYICVIYIYMSYIYMSYIYIIYIIYIYISLDINIASVICLVENYKPDELPNSGSMFFRSGSSGSKLQDSSVRSSQIPPKKGGTLEPYPLVYGDGSKPIVPLFCYIKS